MRDGDDLAFPTANVSNGMTLRDYFAAKAMQAIIAKLPPFHSDDVAPEAPEKSVAVGAFAYADAMLAERSKTND